MKARAPAQTKTIDKVLANTMPSDLFFDQRSFLFIFSINAFTGRMRSNDAHGKITFCIKLCVLKDTTFTAILEAETKADLRQGFVNSLWVKRMHTLAATAMR